jgi:BirA family biotin operon repressor/biotin-[acetyl-CoA-carboxylase] ligase
MAVWKHLQALRDIGVPVKAVRGKGYRLSVAGGLLDEQAILSGVTPQTRASLNSIEVFLEIDSTNTHLRDRALAGAPSGLVCLAEMQHAGRGRHNRQWVSPFAANLNLSLLWRSAAGAAALGGLSLAAGVAVLRSLRVHGIDGVGLKWPNDLLVDSAKLAGILIDVIGESSGPCAVIIGIGINVAMPGPAGAGIEQSWTDLCAVTGRAEFPRNRIAIDLLDHVIAVLADFESNGLQPFLDEWRRNDVIKGRQVNLDVPDGIITGRACGIDAGGALLVETPAGRRRFASGEVRLRIAP